MESVFSTAIFLSFLFKFFFPKLNVVKIFITVCIIRGCALKKRMNGKCF